MDIWKTRPGLESTLMRTTCRRNWYDDEILRLFHQRNLKKDIIYGLHLMKQKYQRQMQ